MADALAARTTEERYNASVRLIRSLEAAQARPSSQAGYFAPSAVLMNPSRSVTSPASITTSDNGRDKHSKGPFVHVVHGPQHLHIRRRSTTPTAPTPAFLRHGFSCLAGRRTFASPMIRKTNRARLTSDAARLIGHPVVASTAVGRGPALLARARAESRPAPPGGGEVPRSGNRT